eukprot:1912704-Amphidinium_carterae.1
MPSVAIVLRSGRKRLCNTRGAEEEQEEKTRAMLLVSHFMQLETHPLRKAIDPLRVRFLFSNANSRAPTLRSLLLI